MAVSPSALNLGHFLFFYPPESLFLNALQAPLQNPLFLLMHFWPSLYIHVYENISLDHPIDNGPPNINMCISSFLLKRHNEEFAE